jgi:hypothetical protein
MPAGNDNLERGVAVLQVSPATRATSIDWRISPEDHTSNYAEIWCGGIAGPPVAGATHPLAIRLRPPGGPEGPGAAGQAGQCCDLTWQSGIHSEVIARIYCRQTHNAAADADPATATEHRLHYVLCTAPTWRMHRRAAPAGAWRIALSVASGTQPVEALLYVQSDQDLRPGTGLGRLSYFDDPLYATHDAAGRLNDSYLHDPVTGVVTTNFSGGPVRRRNTINAITGSVGTLTIAGYRRRDGMPADYSSAGRNLPPPDDVVGGVVRDPDYACVSDDGVWHSGRLAAGGRSGSAAVMQGTSFATGEATRIVACDLLRQMDAGVAGPALVVDGPGFVANVPDPDPYPDPADPPYELAPSQMPLKLGAARLPRQDHGRVPR